MEIVTRNPTRLCIFFFYDSEGVVDDYLVFYLDDLSKNLSEMVIVCNGKLNAAGRNRFEKYTKNIIVRENIGLDVWAYRTGIDFFGWEKLRSFDEVVLANSTLMGPIYPFKEMFDAMAKRDVDFWGITMFHGIDGDPTGCCPYHRIFPHIQSHFTVYRISFLQAFDLEQYWNNIPEINSYNESIGKHEAFFTKHFADKGFKWEVYVDSSGWMELTDHPILMCPKKIIQQYRCPVFKRRNFFHPYSMMANFSAGGITRELFEFLSNETNYDVDLIWQNVLRTMNQADFSKELCLDFVLPSHENEIFGSQAKNLSVSIALFIYITRPLHLEQTKPYIAALAENADIYILTTTEADKKSILAAFDIPCRQVSVSVINKRSGINIALLLHAKDILSKYDFVCFANDFRDERFSPYTIGNGYLQWVLENILKNRYYVIGVLNAFKENPRLGMLAAPKPIHGMYFRDMMANRWGQQNQLFNITQKWLISFGLEVPISKDKEPLASYGGMYWLRTAALKRILVDNSINNIFLSYSSSCSEDEENEALNYLLPLIVQAEGYYPARAMSEDAVAMRLALHDQYLEMYAQTVTSAGLYSAEFLSVNNELVIRLNQGSEKNGSIITGRSSAYYKLRKIILRHLPQGFRRWLSAVRMKYYASKRIE